MQLVKLDIGAGMRPHDGFISIDCRPYKGIDYVLDIGKEILPFGNETVDEILSDNVYEHLTSQELFFSFDECFRVLKPTGFIEVRVPIYGTQAWLIHPDHKMHWTQDLFGFFAVPDNPGTIDPHGYLAGFWHLQFVESGHPETIWCRMSPNKPGHPKYKPVTRTDETASCNP